MQHPLPERRETPERRLSLDRRLGERRSGTASSVAADRRSGGDRRAQLERRMALQSAEAQIHGALKLLTTLAEDAKIGDHERRGLEAAMLRLRFALERMSPTSS